MSSDRQARITSRIAELSPHGSPNDRLCRGCVEILNVDSAEVALDVIEGRISIDQLASSSA